MKFSTVFAMLAAATVSVSAVSTADTNAARLARGLAPKAPTKRDTARRSAASGECKPLLQSCAVNSECCADLCLLGLCG
ncbi:hypothetical protein FIBSPDRAFT_857752 [Athelia psychrophila]|uniref:Uncharacterized protein n=1 Tax=Athelia psychrophila TaxID=1759441 RepID=A0A166MGQ5_9AGAM|nr:hypothetical protein FIBSPDRAFT_857752 [Fibularhizoctonia sp. CBS 109695]